MDEQELAYIQQLEAESEQAKAQADTYRAAVTSSGFFNKDDPNMISAQVDPTETLIKMEHYLRADVPTIDKKGNRIYIEQTEEDLKLLNEYGICRIMNILSGYICKENLLSYYLDEERIYEIVADLGDNLRLFFLCNYDKMGLNTAYKKSCFVLIVKNILDLTESTYRRALHAKQLEEINTGRIVNQTTPLSSGSQQFNKPKKWYSGHFGG
jgi:hypothetical protein